MVVTVVSEPFLGAIHPYLAMSALSYPLNYIQQVPSMAYTCQPLLVQVELTTLGGRDGQLLSAVEFHRLTGPLPLIHPIAVVVFATLFGVADLFVVGNKSFSFVLLAVPPAALA